MSTSGKLPSTVRSRGPKLVGVKMTKGITGSRKTGNTSSNILIRGVRPDDVLTKYLDGVFTTVTLPEKREINTKIPKMQDYGTDPEKSQVYYYTDRQSRRVIVATGNHTPYIQFVHNNYDPHTVIDLSNMNYPCYWCRRPLDKYRKTVVGIPIKINRTVTDQTGIFSFDCDDYGCYCDERCAYSSLKANYRNPITLRDSLWEDSESLLRFIYRLKYGDQTLKEAKDFRLLKINGGPLDDDEYDSYENYDFSKSSNVIYLPIKKMYPQHPR